MVKAFLELATRNTVNELQAFTNTYVPPPFWAACVSCTVPLACCNKAADILIDWFDPEELRTIVGGERWWQVRGLDGIDAEWVTQKEYLDSNEPKKADKKKLSDVEENVLRMEHLETVMVCHVWLQ